MNEKELKEWHNKAFGNMREINRLKGMCGCFCCCETFNYNEINEYIEENEEDTVRTALCPTCEIDSVLPSEDMELLGAMRKRYFGKG